MFYKKEYLLKNSLCKKKIYHKHYVHMFFVKTKTKTTNVQLTA